MRTQPLTSLRDVEVAQLRSFIAQLEANRAAWRVRLLRAHTIPGMLRAERGITAASRLIERALEQLRQLGALAC